MWLWFRLSHLSYFLLQTCVPPEHIFYFRKVWFFESIFFIHVFPQHCPSLNSQLAFRLPSPFLPITRGRICYFRSIPMSIIFFSRPTISTIWSSTSVMVSLESLTISTAQTSCSGQKPPCLAFLSFSIFTLTFTFFQHKKNMWLSSSEKARLTTDTSPCWEANRWGRPSLIKSRNDMWSN